MVVSRRERYIAIAAGAVLALFVLDQWIITPLMQRQADLDLRLSRAQQELERAENLFSNQRRISRKWTEMVRAGLDRDASDAESQLLHNVRDWAADAGFTLASLRPERSEKVNDFRTATVRATGSGSMEQVGRFLYRLHVTGMPVRVTDMQLTTRREGVDDLALQVGIATVHLAREVPK